MKSKDAIILISTYVETAMTGRSDDETAIREVRRVCDEEIEFPQRPPPRAAA